MFDLKTDLMESSKALKKKPWALKLTGRLLIRNWMEIQDKVPSICLDFLIILSTWIVTLLGAHLIQDDSLVATNLLKKKRAPIELPTGKVSRYIY